MICVRNAAVQDTPLSIAATGIIVPFDTVVKNTNKNCNLINNTIAVGVTGTYDTNCQLTLENGGTSAVMVSLQVYADGKAVDGAEATTSIAASSTAQLNFEWPVTIKTAQNGLANISWFISGGAVTLSNAVATMYKYV